MSRKKLFTKPKYCRSSSLASNVTIIKLKKARKLFLFVNLVKPSWFALRVTPTHFIMILRSRVSSFLSTVKKKGERGGEIPHLAANRHKTASLQNESLVFTTHLRERYKRFIFEVIKRGLKVSL